MAKKRKPSYDKRNQNNPENRSKVVVTTSSEPKKVIQPTTSKLAGRKTSTAPSEPMLFNKQHYILMGVGIALMFLGLMLMSGGAQAPNEWNADEVYSVRRTVLAPIIMLIGLGIELYTIFKK